MISDIISTLFTKFPLVGAIGAVALILLVSYWFANVIGQKRMGSAIAIVVALILAFIAGKFTDGSKGVSDITYFSGFALLGGSMLRDFAIISTAFGAKLENLKKAGLPGIVSLLLGVTFSFVVGSVIAYVMGYHDAVDVATIGAGTVTFIVGPVTGTALGASSEVIALSIAAGVVKSVLTMIITPFIAKAIKLDNPTTAMVYGGLIGTTSGVAGGLAATDPKLVPYGAMTATFYTGLGSLVCPSLGYMVLKIFL
ncbi:malonate transporter subunit MadM [Fusibacter bizertensis]|uniref:Malonate transporter subunit MadM n=1 Tax=Fusibacter bizertensis TaxID=1488331 RepID=A0ABT6N9S7_9FIRM|nr:malonate transporter subunit MadM [Fusibacter bizertensis]MDH8677175.1 malonate transporter subunit MadM [Fusibacter bizertensis]